MPKARSLYASNPPLGPQTGAYIDPARVIDWTMAGIDGGIPNYTTVFADVVTDYSADDTGVADATAAFQSAHDACPSGQVVTIPAGTFRIDGTINVTTDMVFRGAGTASSFLQLYTTNYQGGIKIGNYPSTPVDTDVTGSPAKGATTITVESITTPSLSVGDYIVIDEINDGVEIINVDESSRDDNTRCMSQITKITAINSLTLTVNPPLFHSFNTANTPQVWKLTEGTTITTGAGLEDFHIERISPDSNPDQSQNMTMVCASGCWIENVKSKNALFRSVDLDRSFRNEVRNCWFDDGFNHVTGGYAYGVVCSNRSTLNLIENNIFYHMRHSMVVKEGACGNVYGYNYSLAQYQGGDNFLGGDMNVHGCHAMFNLFEGNIGSKIHADFVHGSSSYNMFFRNYVHRVAISPEYPSGQTGGLVCVNIERTNWYENVVGNVLGLASQSWTAFEDAGTRAPSIDTHVYQWGYNNDGDTTVDDTNSKATVYRHGNYDEQSDSTIWDASNGVHKLPNSLYLSAAPASYAGTGIAWPTIGPDITPMFADIPAKVTYGSSNVADLSFATVSAAVAAAVDGDTLILPAGDVTWSESVTTNSSAIVFTGKALTIKGAGSDGTGTNITSNCTGTQSHLFGFTNTDTAQTRITGIRFLNGTFDRRFLRAVKSNVIPFRIDNCEFYNDSNAIAIDVFGDSEGKGLIDNCHFEGDGNFEQIHNFGEGSAGWASGTSPAVNPGSDEAVYVEDCTCQNNRAIGFFAGGSLLQSYNAARTVARYNNLYYSQIDQHGTAGNVGALWWELYNNDFEIPDRPSSSDRNQDKYFDIRAGSGVIYNNTKSGAVNGSTANHLIFREEDSGSYPLDYQVGVTIDQAAKPAYAWGNDSDVKPTVYDGIVWDRDVFADFHSTTSDTGVVVSASEPGSPATGDGWFDTGTNELKVYDGAAYNVYYTAYTYPHPYNTGAE